MDFSLPPNESTKKLMKVFGLSDSKVVEFHINIKNGEPTTIEVKQLVTIDELSKVVEVLRHYKFKEDV